MNRFFYFFIFLSFNSSFCQIKIGDNPELIDSNSLLELESSSKVLVISKLTNVEMLQLVPLEGAIVYNTDEDCIFYFNNQAWVSLCNQITNGSEVTLEDNGDGTFTFNNTNNVPITFNGAEDIISSLVDNLDGTYTYINENGDETLLALNGVSFVDNEDDTYTFTNSDGSEVIINNDNNVQETTSTLEDNLDGTYTYINEEGEITEVNTNTTVEGFTGDPGSVVFAGVDGKPSEDNQNIFYDENNIRLGIGGNAPNSTISVSGSLSTAIDFVGGTAFVLDESNHTALVSGSGNVTLFLPPADSATGRMYIVKINPSITLSVPLGYLDSNSDRLFEVPDGIHVVWFQSNGFTWEQVN
ncbi:hypothetical protein PXD56_02690 [Maribacter sp. SA7]|uniref:hypothetical protein n=1 Tax=Maribacter zhoushanensis TaxID=3030012 RepID=UPI0023ECFA09|nr:hypothetical protein [Maribacter zhoushanensis]MDF4201845.1 hypothetical protein [Maribacter zhoushanensis]